MKETADYPDFQQQDAIAFGEGVAIVKAAAGSGKTRVIESRISELLKSNAQPSEILVLSHTNKAADELRSRLSNPEANAIMVGTIHSLCHRILRQYPKESGLPKNFTVATPADLRELAKEVCEVLRKKGHRGIPKASHILAGLSFSRNTGCSFPDALSTLHPGRSYSNPLLKEFARRYRQRKQKCGLVDFDDLLRFAVQMLRKNRKVRTSLHHQHRHIMVDEFQDTNGMQLRFIKLLLGPPLKANGRSLMVVGDPGQSIYGFRGARIENWQDVRKIPGARQFPLQTNYRSSPQIVAVANIFDDRTLIERAPARAPTDAPKSKKPRLTAYSRTDEEAEDLCALIKQHQAEGIPISQQAILCRTSSNFPAIKAALEARDIPVQQVGGKRSRPDAVIESVIGVFRVAANRKDVPALQKLLQLIPGIGKKRAEKIGRKASRASTPKEFHQIIHDEVASRHVNAGNLVVALKGVRKATDLGKAVENVLKAIIALSPKRKVSPEVMQELVRQLEALQAQAHGSIDLREFVATLALEQQNNYADTATERVTLSTIHGAKGLEWDVVYLPRLNEGHLPHAKARVAEGIAEERRMLYVAVTRARRHLYMSYIQPTNGESGTGASGPSRFLSLPDLAVKVQRHTVGR